MTNKPDPDFWAISDTETLQHELVEDAVREYLDDFMSPHMTQEDWDRLPETFEVLGYNRMTPNVECYCRMLEDLLEYLDEEFGNPNGDPTQPTPGMQQAEKEFIEKVLKEYEVYQCEYSGDKVTISTIDWIREHEPEWLHDYPQEDK